MHGMHFHFLYLLQFLIHMYMLPLANICIRRHGVSLHCYADDTPLCVPINLSMLSSLHECLVDPVETGCQRLSFNLTVQRQRFLLFAPAPQIHNYCHLLGTFHNTITPVARNLGLLFDHNLSFELHVYKSFKDSESI